MTLICQGDKGGEGGSLTIEETLGFKLLLWQWEESSRGKGYMDTYG